MATVIHKVNHVDDPHVASYKLDRLVKEMKKDLRDELLEKLEVYLNGNAYKEATKQDLEWPFEMFLKLLQKERIIITSGRYVNSSVGKDLFPRTGTLH